jgi:ubiquinone/menaquinone biosynthesis C-methylase UbiE
VLLGDDQAGMLLDLGTCFGFFAPRIAAGHDPAVQAGDISPGTCDLLARVSLRLGTPVPVIVCDAACVPLPDAGIDTVTLLHVVEHVDAAHGDAILREAVRLARRRVIIAVPLERERTPPSGMSAPSTCRNWPPPAPCTPPPGRRERVEEFHGGWLVLDRLLPPALQH